MPGNSDIDYISWYGQAFDKREDLRHELAEIEGLIQHLEPLALRAGMVRRSDVAALAAEVTQPPAEPPPPATDGDGAGQPAVGEDDDIAPPPLTLTSEDSTDGADNLPYRGMPSTDAAMAYLESAGDPRTTRQVADALKAGGLESTSPNYTVNIYTSLKRLRKRGAIDQVGAGTWQAKKAAGE